MDWLQIASSLGIGGTLGAIIGALSALQNAKKKFNALMESIQKIAPQYQSHIQKEFDEFRATLDPLIKLFRKL
ncbi:MAG: hypothetical protein ACK53G_03625 [Armatimonadota bacterium]|jgi:gas vesicle protein